MLRYGQLILDILKSSKGHMTAEEIYMKAKQNQSSIAIGTVYRNLGQMTETGKIRRVIMQDMPDRYDSTLHPHEHALCRKCGELSDISVSNLKEYLEKQTGLKILGYDLNIRYECGKCSSVEQTEHYKAKS